MEESRSSLEVQDPRPASTLLSGMHGFLDSPVGRVVLVDVAKFLLEHAELDRRAAPDMARQKALRGTARGRRQKLKILLDFLREDAPGRG